jgi:hypothetical protein
MAHKLDFCLLQESLLIILCTSSQTVMLMISISYFSRVATRIHNQVICNAYHTIDINECLSELSLKYFAAEIEPK